MAYNYPYSFFTPRRYPHYNYKYPNYYRPMYNPKIEKEDKKQIETKPENSSLSLHTNVKDKIEDEELRECFEIFGIKLFFDDILLICLIFFLYNEGVKDQYLFISLILLLLS